jgi:hypothetical protein
MYNLTISTSFQTKDYKVVLPISKQALSQQHPNMLHVLKIGPNQDIEAE